MAKRDSGKQAETAAVSDAVEQRLLAFAEQVWRMAGTVSAKAEGWMDREALKKQIGGVRDSASELLEHLSDGVTKVTGRVKKTAVKAAATAKRQGRGLVDAPGKKHRKPTPPDARAIAADAKRATMRSSVASMKTTKKRGRG